MPQNISAYYDVVTRFQRWQSQKYEFGEELGAKKRIEKEILLG